MDEATFTRELNKYKVVRPSDYHKSRSGRTKHEIKPSTRPVSSSSTVATASNAAAGANSAVATTSAGASSSGAGASSSGARSSNNANGHGDFLTLLSAAAKGILTSVELEKLLASLAEVQYC
jgi:cobalamin biosynthesis Mg chelatase CobN